MRLIFRKGGTNVPAWGWDEIVIRQLLAAGLAFSASLGTFDGPGVDAEVLDDPATTYETVVVETPLTYLELPLDGPQTAEEILSTLPDTERLDADGSGDELRVVYPYSTTVTSVAFDPATGATVGEPETDLVAFDSGLGEFDPRESATTYRSIYCDRYYKFKDAFGVFTVQRACGTRAAPWGFRWKSWVGDEMYGGIIDAEMGLDWSKNGSPQPRNGPHASVRWDYLFHGTFRGPDGVTAGDKVRYWDTFLWTPSSTIASNGGYIKGRLHFRAAL